MEYALVNRFPHHAHVALLQKIAYCSKIILDRLNSIFQIYASILGTILTVRDARGVIENKVVQFNLCQISVKLLSVIL